MGNSSANLLTRDEVYFSFIHTFTQSLAHAADGYV